MNGAPSRLRGFARERLYYGLLLIPHGRRMHAQVLRDRPRSDSHTYTCFHRSPLQLEALIGPVVDRLVTQGRRSITISEFACSYGAEAYTIASELLFRRPDVTFTIRASDLHAETIAKAKAATYTLDEITQGLMVPAEFIQRTFDKTGEAYVVKPAIRERVSFEQADLLDPHLGERFAEADIVLLQNVLFHMPSDMARRVLQSVSRLVARGGFLFLDGMELDMRVALTRQLGLEPLDFKVREIHDYSRRHVPEPWWDHYYGSEPYTWLSSSRLRRYGTIFSAPSV
jgi:SAM-dependent methyltransferase